VRLCRNSGRAWEECPQVRCRRRSRRTYLGRQVFPCSPGAVSSGAYVHAGEIKGLGAFAQYTLADEKIAFKLPPGLSRNSASTIPLAATTAWLALFSRDCLSMDRGQKQSVLIWGGSCQLRPPWKPIKTKFTDNFITASVGQYAIQLASLYFSNIITTCSPRNFDLVKSLGATHVFDHSAVDTTERIHEVAPKLKHVFDTIGNAGSSAKACQAANPDCTLCTVRPGKANTDQVPESVNVTDVLVWTAFLKDHSYGKFRWPASCHIFFKLGHLMTM
jgi:NADPH:quinone reductase-like Zn-dependent oxidoreductase